MGVYKYKGKWKAEIWKTGQRLETKAGFETKELAKEWYHQTLLSLQSNSVQVKKSKETTFDDLLDYYLKIHMPTVSPETQRRYGTDINGRILKFFQNRPLETITPLMIESFRSKLMRELKPKSVNNCTMLLRSIFKKGEEWGMLEKNPFKLRALKIADQKVSWWEKKEHIQAFLESAKADQFYAAYRLALECGLRLGEIVGLSKQDINFERNQIHIHRQWLNRLECFGPTKGRRERFVYFNPYSDLKDVLKEAINKSPDKEIIFLTTRGVRVKPRHLATRHFQRVMKRADVPRIRFHDLRHTFASWYMIEVGDIWALKGILGHVDVQTTQRYAHLSDRHQTAPILSWTMNENFSENKFLTIHSRSKSKTTAKNVIITKG